MSATRPLPRSAVTLRWGLFELLADAQAIKHNGMPADLATIPFRIWDAAWMTGPSGRNRSTPAATSSPF